MKYAVVEALNYAFAGDHPSGLEITDGDGDEQVFLSCVGKMYNNRKDACKAIDKYLDNLKKAIEESEELKDGWLLEYDCDTWCLCVEQYEELTDDEDGEEYDDEPLDSEWLIKCEVIEIPETDEEIEKPQSLLDFVKYWWLE